MLHHRGRKTTETLIGHGRQGVRLFKEHWSPNGMKSKKVKTEIYPLDLIMVT